MTARLQRWLPLALLVGGLALSAGLAWRQHTDNARQLVEATLAEARRTVERSVEQVERSVAGLKGARGYLMGAGADHATAEGFRGYMATRNLGTEFPGVMGHGFIRRVAPAAESAYLERMRKQVAPDFSVHALQPHDGERRVIQFIEPLEPNRAARGLDIASEPNRRLASELALQSDVPVLTGPIRLVQSQPGSSMGVLLLLPMPAVAEAGFGISAGPSGYTYAPIQLDALLAAAGLRLDLVQLRLTDVTDASRPQDFQIPAGSTDVAADAPSITEDRAIMRRQWRFSVQPRAALAASLHQTAPLTVAGIGAALSLLLAALARLWLTLRQRTADALAERVRLVTLLDNANDAIVGLDLGGRVVLWNQAATQLFGFSADEAVGRALRDLTVDAAHQGEDDAVLRAAQSGGTTAPFETTRLRKGGAPVEVEVSAGPMYDAAGRVVGVAKVMRPIQERMERLRRITARGEDLEHQVAASSAQVEAGRRDLQSVLDAVPSLVGAWDAQLHNRFANAAYVEYFGRTPEEISRMTLPELLGPQLWALNEPHVRGALAGHNQQFERELPLKGGQGVRRTLVHYLPYRENGVVAGFYVLAPDVTELEEVRRQAGAATRRADALLDLVHRHAIVSMTDRGGRIVDVNDAFCGISGYSREELVGRTHRVVHSGTQGPDFWPQVWRSIAAGTSWRGEVCNRAKDGALYWVNSIIAPIVGPSGNVESYLSVRFDITPRKVAEAALAERERVMRLVMNAFPGVLAYWDRDMRCVYANRAYDEWLGIESERMIGRTQREILDAETFARNEPLMQAAMRGEACTVERQRVTASGRQVDYLLHYVPDGEGANVRGFISATVDITSRKRAEEEANRMSAQLRAVLDAATEVSIIAVETDGKVSLFNSGAERLLGYRRDDVLGVATVLDFHDGEEMRQRALALSAETGRTVRTGMVLIDEAALGCPHDWTYRRKDGSKVRVSLSVTSILDGGGRCVGYLGVAHDVTRQKDYERSLQVAAEAAAAASLAKGQFLSNMSHEIRTPLNAIIGLSYLLERESLSPEPMSQVRRIALAARSLLGIVNDVLDLSKIEAGQFQLDQRVFDLMALLEGELGVHGGTAAAKGLALTLEAAPDVPKVVRGDDGRLRQVLANLLSNALKFTERGEVHMQVRRGANDPAIEFVVSDTGIGIEPQVQQRLFQPFEQADASTARRFGGSGLGLSIVAQLVRLMGGTVTLRSEPGRGSQFTVTLPLPAARADEMDTAEPHEAVLRVLLAEDDDVQRTQLAETVKSLGWQCVAVPGGEPLVVEGERAAGQGQPFDVLIVDWQMPDLDGLQALERLRERLHDDPWPAVVMVTQHEPESLRRDPRAGLVSAVVGKPVDPSALYNAVGEGLAAQPARVGKLLDASLRPGEDLLWLSGARILVVDDSVLNLEVARKVLEREGALVVTCESGPAALKTLQNLHQSFDAVLMDVQMPDMDGLEVTRRARKVAGAGGLPIIALTAGVLREERDRALAAGMNDCLPKPLDPRRMIACLRKQVERQTGRILPVEPRRQGRPEGGAAIEPLGIDGIDEVAIDRGLRSDRPLLLSMLKRLLGEFADVAAVGEEKLPARMHKLRGSAQVIGASSIAAAAAAVESACRGVDAGSIRAAVDSLDLQLKRLANAAERMLAAESLRLETNDAALAQQSLTATPATQEQVKELRALIESQSTRALAMAKVLAPALMTEFGTEHVKNLIAALEDFDFHLAACELGGASAS